VPVLVAVLAAAGPTADAPALARVAYFEREPAVRDRLPAERPRPRPLWRALLPLLLLAPVIGLGRATLSEPGDPTARPPAPTTRSEPAPVTTTTIPTPR
jgi:hypothetical protein